MRVDAYRRLSRDLEKSPAEVHAWALGWMEAAKKSGATFSEVIADAAPMKGGDFRGCYVRKWRRKAPHGEYRLLFRADEEEVTFISLEPRGSDYKIARRRIRALPR